MNRWQQVAACAAVFVGVACSVGRVHAQASEAAAVVEAHDESQPSAPTEVDSASAVQQVPAEQARDQRRLSLEHAIAGVRQERDDKSLLAPWLLTAVGLSALAAGVGFGLGHALFCTHSCRTPFWPGWSVVAGTTLTTAGVVWIEIKQRDIAELELRQRSLEHELEQVHWEARLVPPVTQARTLVAWRGTF